MTQFPSGEPSTTASSDQPDATFYGPMDVATNLRRQSCCSLASLSGLLLLTLAFGLWLVIRGGR